MKRLLLALLVPACLSVPSGPEPECKVTSDCDTANGEAWSFLEGTDTPVVEKPFSSFAFEDAVRRVVPA